MLLFKPCKDCAPQLLRECQQFRGFLAGNLTNRIIFCEIPLCSALFEIVGVVLALSTQDQRQSLQSPVVSEILFGTIAFAVEQNGAKFQGGIIGYAELPIAGEISRRILQVAICNG